MSSVRAGHYQGPLQDLGGNALTTAEVEVRIAGTATPAVLYNNAVVIAEATEDDSLGNSPVESAAGEGKPGVDIGATLTFYADASLEYDIVGTRGNDVLGPFQVKPKVDHREGARASSVVLRSVGVLERAGVVVSGSFDSLGDWRAALATVRAGTANARMLCIGDSTTGGWPTSYVDRCADLWAANRLSTARHGAIFTTDPATYVEGRVAYGTGWSNGGVGDFGPANRGVALGAVGAAGTLDTGPVSCDRFEIFFFDAGVGTFDWWIDGGSHTTVTVGATAAVRSVVTPSVTAGTHTLHIGNIVGSPAFIPFPEPRTGTSGLYVARFGLGATTSTMWAQAGSLFASSPLVFHALQPDLTVMMLVSGDFNTQADLETYHDNIDGMVVLAQTYGSVVLGVPPRSTITAYDDYNAWDEYVEVLETIRDDRDVAMVNFANHFAADDPDLYMADTLHPRVEAQGEMALVLAGALMP